MDGFSYFRCLISPLFPSSPLSLISPHLSLPLLPLSLPITSSLISLLPPLLFLHLIFRFSFYPFHATRQGNLMTQPDPLLLHLTISHFHSQLTTTHHHSPLAIHHLPTTTVQQRPLQTQHLTASLLSPQPLSIAIQNLSNA